MVGLSVTQSVTQMADQGWTSVLGEGVLTDSVNGVEFLYQLYSRANPTYSRPCHGTCAVDKQRHTIVSNESAEIIWMFNGAFDGVSAAIGDYYPAPPACRDRPHKRPDL